MLVEVLGVNACHGQLGKKMLGKAIKNLPEVSLRVAVRANKRLSVETFSRCLAPLILSGPPFATSYFGSKGDIREVFAYWPSLVSRTTIQTKFAFI